GSWPATRSSAMPTSSRTRGTTSTGGSWSCSSVPSNRRPAGFRGTGLALPRQPAFGTEPVPREESGVILSGPAGFFEAGCGAILALRPRRIDPFFGVHRGRGAAPRTAGLLRKCPPEPPAADSSSLSLLRRPAARGALGFGSRAEKRGWSAGALDRTQCQLHTRRLEW